MANIKMNFENYYTVIEDAKVGKFIDVFYTPDESSIKSLKQDYKDEGSLDKEIFIMPLDEALDFVREHYPERKAVCGHGQKDPELKRYIESRGFAFFN